MYDKFITKVDIHVRVAGLSCYIFCFETGS